MPSTKNTVAPRGFRLIPRFLSDPYRRFRYAKIIHGTRVGIGILLAIAITTIFDIPHGEWSSISLLIVIAGLQHHGNIRRRATERAFGTLIGAVVGLSIIVQQMVLGMPVLSWMLICIACGVSAYHAIGKGGYIALLSAITVVIVAGHGDNAFIDGVWRTVNVLIGIAIALLFSFALPLYATYSWRYKLAEALRGCATIHSRVISPDDFSFETHTLAMAKQRALLIELRSLIPSVIKEVAVPAKKMEEIQHNLRIIVSALELLPSLRPNAGDPAGVDFVATGMAPQMRGIRDILLGASRALKGGSLVRLQPRDIAIPDTAVRRHPAHMDGYVLLTLNLLENVDQIRASLMNESRHWNI